VPNQPLLRPQVEVSVEFSEGTRIGSLRYPAFYAGAGSESGGIGIGLLHP
jgi:hypothetical protein